MNLNVLVAFEPLAAHIDIDEFERRFPTVTLSTTPYDVPYSVSDERSTGDPTRAGGDLTDAQRAAFARAHVVATFNLPSHLKTVAPQLRWVQGIGSGIGHFLDSGADEHLYTNAAGCAAPSIAEWVVAQVFAIHKRLPEHYEQQRRHAWTTRTGNLLMGRSVLVVGTGAIGTEVAWRLDALGLHVTGIRRRVDQTAPLPRGFRALAPTEQLLAHVADKDVVVACVPGGPATRHLFDAEFFAAMRPGAVFINVGRGSSVDEAALLQALRSDHLGGAAIDVAQTEPLPADDPLWDAPRLTVSPHSSASMDGYMQRVLDLFYDNLDRFISGRPLRNVVDLVEEYGAGAL